ncbi:MAG: DUF4910 domain-containing protein [Campylobacterales bacterium]
MPELYQQIYELATKLYPIPRSLTGEGVRQTLQFIKEEHLPNLKIKSIPSGTPCFDWFAPKEWIINDAYIITPKGQKIAHFKEHNLHLVGYSIPVRCKLPLSELQKHIFTLPENPDAIPYVTSYYKETWGFCLPYTTLSNLPEGEYEVVIESKLIDGVMNYGELFLEGQQEEEVLITTYVCHPSLANNEISGPSVVTFLAKWLESINRSLSYRILFIPETIGVFCYLSRHLEQIKKVTIAGFNVTCIGDERAYSFVPTRYGNKTIDKIARHILKYIDPTYKEYPFTEAGSNERHLNAPGIDLPVISVMRSKYGEYPEYHTSKDDLHLISPAGLGGGFEAIRQMIVALEENKIYQVTTLGEPQLGRRGLYPTTSTLDTWRQVNTLKNLLAYMDGTQDLVSICERIGVSIHDALPLVKRLTEEGLITTICPQE